MGVHDLGSMADTADADLVPDTKVEPPTEPGFYKYSGGNQTLIFHLDPWGQWWAWLDLCIDKVERCEWGYIEQALDVWDLEKIT